MIMWRQSVDKRSLKAMITYHLSSVFISTPSNVYMGTSGTHNPLPFVTPDHDSNTLSPCSYSILHEMELAWIQVKK